MEQAGWAMVRYADDFVILGRSAAEAQPALAEVRHWVSEAHRRWPNEWFARRGLLSLAAAPEWTWTIVRLRTH